MQYLIYDTKALAQSRSAEEAINRGCSPDSVTSYWWGIIEHIDGRAALQISDPEALNAIEQTMLNSQEEMDADGWFPVMEELI